MKPELEDICRPASVLLTTTSRFLRATSLAPGRELLELPFSGTLKDTKGHRNLLGWPGFLYPLYKTILYYTIM